MSEQWSAGVITFEHWPAGLPHDAFQASQPSLAAVFVLALSRPGPLLTARLLASLFWIKNTWEKGFPGGPWSGLGTFNARCPVQSLVGELRSCKPSGLASQAKTNKQKILQRHNTQIQYMVIVWEQTNWKKKKSFVDNQGSLNKKWVLDYVKKLLFILLVTENYYF